MTYSVQYSVHYSSELGPEQVWVNESLDNSNVLLGVEKKMYDMHLY